MEQDSGRSKLYKDIEEFQWPIIYKKKYNVKFCGLENFHPFDSCKWGNIFEYLGTHGLLDDNTYVEPNEAKKEDLLLVHPKIYLKKLQCSLYVAQIAEIACLALVPNFIVQKLYLRPMRFQTGGSILAGKLAIERGWAINLGGGFHHCSANKGAGFCPYADITLMIHNLFIHYPQLIKTVMIIDLDAHQGNGYERDFLGDSRVFILDMYNKNIYPKDYTAKQAISLHVPITNYIRDEEYLNFLDLALSKAFERCKPNFLVYNAGTDILDGDTLGELCVSPQGVIKRDEMVFRAAIIRNIPIAMLTSGGYLQTSAKVIGKSIINLYEKSLLTPPRHRY